MNTSKRPSVSAHLRSILALPFMVTIVIPFFIYYRSEETVLFNWFLAYRSIFIIAGVLLLLIGLFLFVSTLRLFHTQGKGTLAPWNPPTKLVIAGPYRYVRNPMITAVNAILLAEAFLIPSGYILLWQLFFFSLNHCYFILKEEPNLEKRFGEDYVKYKQKVPRWLPRLKPYD